MKNQTQEKKNLQAEISPFILQEKKKDNFTNNYSPFPFPELILMKANGANKVIIIEWYISGVSESSQELRQWIHI